MKRRGKIVFAILEIPDRRAELVIHGTMHPRHDGLDEVKAPVGFGNHEMTEHPGPIEP